MTMQPRTFRHAECHEGSPQPPPGILRVILQLPSLLDRCGANVKKLLRLRSVLPLVSVTPSIASVAGMSTRTGDAGGTGSWLAFCAFVLEYDRAKAAKRQGSVLPLCSAVGIHARVPRRATTRELAAVIASKRRALLVCVESVSPAQVARRSWTTGSSGR